MTTCLGIYREPICSPGRHLANDAMILELVAGHLRANGHRVTLATLDDAEPIRHEASLIFSMCQSLDGLRTIGAWESDGATVVNRSAASRSTYREALIPTLRRHGLPVPTTTFVATGRTARPDAGTVLGDGGRWVKRGDLHASVPDDVRWVETGEALDRTLDDFDRRGIAIAAVQAHAAGRELKFYAVRGSGFFHCQVADGIPADPSDEATARALAADTATALDLDIFGGDIVIAADHRPTLIDVNDWPSFAPCRERAAAAIGEYLETRLDPDRIRAVPASANAPTV
jgi:glutathione synthase/RimK-type ligase-like ATP-grasp enzyme